MREDSRRNLKNVVALGLIAGGALVACSAKDDGPNGGIGGLGGMGNTPGGGSGGGGMGAQGGVAPNTGGTIIGPNGSGGTSAGGSTGSGGVINNQTGKLGNPSENACADAAKFANAQPGGRLLYPYDGTVFPKGLLGPLMMWEGDADQILLEAKSANWNYTSCPATPDKVRYQIPNDIWARAASWSDGTADPLTIKITKLSGGAVSGQMTVNVLFALATLKGAIYYNTYGAVGSLTNGNGAVLKIVPGQDKPTVFLTDTGVPPLGPCRSCHALSANGMMMTANHHLYPGILYESESYDVTGPTPTLLKGGIPEAGFAGIFPDGSRMMTNGPPNVSVSPFFPTAPNNVGALLPAKSHLISRDGNPVSPPVQGWTVEHAQMPMFSPDGKFIVYNDHDKGQGHALWMANFDATTNTFSAHKEIYKSADRYPSWPFFTPDSKKIIFTDGTRSDFCSQIPEITGPPLMTPTGRGHLMIVDVATGAATKMDVANGYKNGQSYLPAGEQRDNNLEFFPTVSPFAAGGFFWTFFTSRRTYGNISTLGLEDPNTKKLWVAAVNIDSASGTDPSHPPFFLPGQELNTGNLRAFGALEPCKEDGAACTTGSDCCKGFCSNINPMTGVGVCGKVVIDQCPKLGDKCETDEQCCKGPDNGANGKRLFCINNQCETKTID